MQNGTDVIKIVDEGLRELVGKVVSEEEHQVLTECANVFRYPVCKNLTWFLENLSKYRVVVGFLYSRSEKILREENGKLDRIAAKRYNSIREAGMRSKLKKAPPAEAIKQSVRGDSEFLDQQMVVSRAEYRRDLLKELQSALSTKSRELDQLSNNMRLEVRIDTED